MKATPFLAKHEALGAKMMAFAGYNMPVSYSGINEEHKAVRESVGVFDVSHMGEFRVYGPEAFDLVQRITSNDISKLHPGRAQYNCMPNDTGGIVDDLIVYHMAEEDYLLVVNAANIDKDWRWIQQQNTMGASMTNLSDDIALLAVQGPKAEDVLQRLTEVDLSQIKFYHFEVGTLAGVDNVIISATGYTGSGGFELYIDKQEAAKVWEAVFEAGQPENIQPIGLGARDTLRLEMGFCLYGNDIDDTTSPLEAGLGWITKFTEGNNFVNRSALEAQKAEGVKKKLVGFVMEDRGIPRHGYDIQNAAGEVIGRVTSGTQSPSLQQAVGLGYVDKAYSAPETEIFIAVRKRNLKAVVTKPPFYKP